MMLANLLQFTNFLVDNILQTNYLTPNAILFSTPTVGFHLVSTKDNILIQMQTYSVEESGDRFV